MPKIPLILLLLTTLLPAQQKVQGWLDIAPKEYPALSFRFDPVNLKENGLPLIHQAISKIMDDPKFETLTPQADHENFDLKKIQAFTSKHKAAIAVLIDSLQRPKLQSTHPKTSISADLEMEMCLVPTARLLRLQLLVALNGGDSKQISQHFNYLKDLSIKAAEIEGPPVVALVHFAVIQNYRAALYEHLAKSENLTREQIEDIAKSRLTESQLIGNLVNANRADFKSSQSLVTKFYTNSDPRFLTNINLRPELPFFEKVKNSVLKTIRNIFFQPNKTISKMAQVSFAHEELIKAPYTKQSQLIRKHRALAEFDLMEKPNLISFNAVGISLANLMKDQSEMYLRIPVETRIYHRLTTLLIATKLYHLDHKTLPNSLADLSPKYLKIIPKDPYTGIPFSYNKAKKTITSAGPKQKLKDPQPFDPENYNFSQIHNQQTPTLLLPF